MFTVEKSQRNGNTKTFKKYRRKQAFCEQWLLNKFPYKNWTSDSFFKAGYRTSFYLRAPWFIPCDKLLKKWSIFPNDGYICSRK